MRRQQKLGRTKSRDTDGSNNSLDTITESPKRVAKHKENAENKENSVLMKQRSTKRWRLFGGTKPKLRSFDKDTKSNSNENLAGKKEDGKKLKKDVEAQPLKNGSVALKERGSVPENRTEKGVPGSQAKKQVPENRAEKGVLGSQAKKQVPENRAEKGVPGSQAKKQVPENRAEKGVLGSQAKKQVPENRAEKGLSQTNEHPKNGLARSTSKDATALSDRKTRTGVTSIKEPPHTKSTLREVNSQESSPKPLRNSLRKPSELRATQNNGFPRSISSSAAPSPRVGQMKRTNSDIKQTEKVFTSLRRAREEKRAEEKMELDEATSTREAKEETGAEKENKRAKLDIKSSSVFDDFKRLVDFSKRYYTENDGQCYY